MKSIRRGLWDGEVEKDTSGRFACRVCGQSLEPRSSDAGDATDGGDSAEAVRTCPDCGRAWEL